ncbi:MAG: sigma 54-interacting transcriptional regulator [Candidatus Thiodiazotropha sp. (ex Ustalcina ferruginea)]|nr:sigma 54-interacting transcriptional regulator [Candidatus Thiodiazotropha sp. (ex Ustalcina ferruginea)]
MRIDVLFSDRVGIAQEILATLASRRLNLTAVEVEPPHIYIDAPTLKSSEFETLTAALREINGVNAVEALSVMPGTRHRLYLDALLASQADPVLAVDAEGVVVVANVAAEKTVDLDVPSLTGIALNELFGNNKLVSTLLTQDYHLPLSEVELSGLPFLVESLPLRDPSGTVAGAMLTLHAPHRIGEQLSALQNIDAGDFESILGDSHEMTVLKQRAARMAQVDAPLLIFGETGTGKELIAHACHAVSSRSSEPFFAINCAALPENLAESELFGYAPGAFTGGLRSGKPGLLELADGGTVFLDEVGEMSPYLQAKLLRFLGEGSFRRVGGEREIKVDVRIISATHRLLEEMVGKGEFRQDLLFRLNVLNLQVPALRERTNDVLPLAQHFIARSCSQAGRSEVRLTSSASAALLTNAWVGNVRQLENVIFRAVTMTERNIIDVGDLELAGASHESGSMDIEDIDTLDGAIEEFEKHILETLYPSFSSTRKLAKRLGVSHSAIAVRMRKYRIGQG